MNIGRCPYCGGERVSVVTRAVEGKKLLAVECHDCLASGLHLRVDADNAERRVITKWNIVSAAFYGDDE